MSQKAWMTAYTKGSKALQARLAQIHKANPEFQDFVKKHGFGGNLSVKQSGQQKKSSVATVKPTTDAHPERSNLDRLAVIKAAAEKQRDRRHAASNRVAFGGELGGSFSMPGGGFRRYSENFELHEASLADKIRAHPGVDYYGGKEDDHMVNLKKGWHMGDGQRSFGNRNVRDVMHDLKRVVKFKPGEAKEYGIDENVATTLRKVVPGLGKLQAKNRALDLDDKLTKGIQNKSLTRKQRMTAAKHIERFARVASGEKAFKTVQKTDEDIAYKDGTISMYRGGWIAKRNGKQIGPTMPTDKHAKDALDSTHRSLGQKTMDVLKRKKQEIARGLGRMSMSVATESAQNRNRISSWDSAVLPVEHDHGMTTPHPKKKLDALRAAGKHVEARELERSWLRKAMAKEKSENSK